MRSISMLTASPIRRTANVVAWRVCGIRLTSNSRPSTSFTVRLTPSIQTQPLLAMNRASPTGTSKRQRSERASGTTSMTRPIPSMWPDTRCPPSGSPMRNAFSRLTKVPACIVPNVVRRRVSRETSAAKRSAPMSSAVRQTPATAMLSPSLTFPNPSEVLANSMRRSPPHSSLVSR